jgi:hypothetical protein
VSGFINPDGSSMVGGELPSGTGQALQLDASGNLKTTATLSAASNQRVNAQAGDFVDGAVVTLGTEADAAATSDTGTFTLMALFKRALQKLTSLVSNTGNIPPPGQTTMAASMPVTIANNQGNVPENLTQVGGSAIALGQTTMAASLPVALASNQSNVPANIAQINGAVPQMSQDDGASLNGLLEIALMGYTSGGPVLANGVPTQLAWDRWRTWLGKGSQSNAITSTTAGDTNLTFSAAPKTLLPGQAIKLSGAAGEYVYVADSFTPSATATVIPLKSPVVNTGQTTAQWSIFNTAGPGGGSVSPEGILLVQETLYDVATGNLYAKQGVRGIQDVSVGGRTSTAIAASTSANTVIKNSPGRLARILVTATGTNEMDVFDNASTNSGTKIGIVPANATVGTIIDCQAPALNGITVGGNSNNPGVTIFYY